MAYRCPAFEKETPVRMSLQSAVIGDANPRGSSRNRHWISRRWDQSRPIAFVIGINPNTATESYNDPMTGFLTKLLRCLEGEYRCSGYILANCCDYRHCKPKALERLAPSCSWENTETIRTMLEKCDFVVASWGTTPYGEKLEVARAKVSSLVRNSGKRAICFSPYKKPIYCSQTNANRGDGRWSETPVIWC